MKPTKDWSAFSVVGNFYRILVKSPKLLTKRQYRILLGYHCAIMLFGFGIVTLATLKMAEIHGDISFFWIPSLIGAIMVPVVQLPMIMVTTQARLKALGASNDEVYTLLIPFYNIYKIWEISQREDI